MGIGPGPECNFNSLDLSNIVDPSNPGDTGTYLVSVAKELYSGTGITISDFSGLVISDRTTTANNIARILKNDDAATANGPPSCNQFDEISQ